MEVIIVAREEDVAKIAADRVQQQIHQKRDSVLGLATEERRFGFTMNSHHVFRRSRYRSRP